MLPLGALPIYVSKLAPTHFDDGRPRLFILCRMPGREHVLVHPSRWDAFQMAVNQPSIFAHPDVRALLVPDDTAAAPRDAPAEPSAVSD